MNKRFKRFDDDLDVENATPEDFLCATLSKLGEWIFCQVLKDEIEEEAGYEWYVQLLENDKPAGRWYKFEMTYEPVAERDVPLDFRPPEGAQRKETLN